MTGVGIDGKYISYLSIFVIVVSLANFGIALTGYASSDQAVVNVTVETSANINFTDSFIDFGSGTVEGGQNFATLESNATSSVNGNWSWSESDNFTLLNIGNVNVTIELATGLDADGFIGGTAANNEYQYMVRDIEAGSCSFNVTEGVWQDVNSTGVGTVICSPLYSADGTDSIVIDVKLVIPSDSLSGGLTDTFTATGTAV